MHKKKQEKAHDPEFSQSYQVLQAYLHISMLVPERRNFIASYIFLALSNSSI